VNLQGWFGICHCCCTLKHHTHISHLRRVHRDRLVKRRGTSKHALHISHLRCVPLINRCIKLLHATKQKRHVRHKRDVPSIGFAVVLYASIVLLDPLLQLLLRLFLKERGTNKRGREEILTTKKCQFEKIKYY